MGDQQLRSTETATPALGIDDTAEVSADELQQMVRSAASIEVSKADDDEGELALDDTAIVPDGDVNDLVQAAAAIDVDGSDG